MPDWDRTRNGILRKLPRVPSCLGVILGSFLLLACFSLAARAAPVGTFVKVEGTVEVLRQGKPPAVSVKVRDGVNKGDLIRTKSQSRAQLRFVDDTDLTISPGSAVLIEDYLYDAPRGTRQAALNLFRGLAYCVVNRILKTEEPDFVVKTHSAVLGVRGTRFFTLAAVKFTGGYNVQGMLEMLHRAFGQKVLLVSMEFAVAARGKRLSKPQRLSAADLALLQQWLVQGVPQRVLTGDPPFVSLLSPLGQKMPSLEMPKELYDGMFVPPTPRPERSQQPMQYY